jgi:hypothetical protein
MGARRRRLTDLGMKLSLPYNHAADYVERMAPFFHAANDVYLAPPPDVAGSLKRFTGSAAGYAAERERLREALAPQGAGLCYTFNAPLPGTNPSRALAFLESELRRDGRAAATVASFDLAVAIHAALPEVELGTSLACGILDVEQARPWVERAGVRVVHPDKLLLRRPRELAAIRSLGVRIKAIINNRCAIHSPRCRAHFACAVLGAGRDEADLAISARCGEDLQREPWRAAPLTLPPAVLPRLQGLVDIVKLDGRNWPTAQLVEDARQALELASWAFHPWYVEPPDAFDMLARCDHRCRTCGWCARNLALYAPEAAEPPHLVHQVLHPGLPTPLGAGALPPAARLPRLFAEADRFGFTVEASRAVHDTAAVEVDLRWHGTGPFRLRLAMRGSALEEPCFRRTRTLSLCYLFEDAKAPPGLRDDLADLGDSIERLDAADGPAEVREEAPRRVADRLEVGGFCVQRCGFCRERPGGARAAGAGSGDPRPDPRLVHPGETRAWVALLERRRGRGASGGVRRLEFAGEDPARRADLPELVAAAVRAGYREVAVIGPANALATAGWAARLAAAGLTHAAVSLLSDRADVHDRLVGRRGAFGETRAAVRRLRQAGTALELSTVALSATLPRLAAMTRLLGAERIHLHLALHPGGLPAKALAPLEALAGAVAATAEALRGDGGELAELHLYGMPRCIAEAVAASWPGRAIYREALRAAQRADSGFAPTCAGCTLRPLCLGVPSWRLAREARALRPISGRGPRRAGEPTGGRPCRGRGAGPGATGSSGRGPRKRRTGRARTARVT